MPGYLRVLVVAVLVSVGVGLLGCHNAQQPGVAAAGADTPCVAPSQFALRGDLNNSGMPDITDAVGILRIIVGLAPAHGLADCTCDGLTGITDAIALLRCIVGLDAWPIVCGGYVPGEDCIGLDGQMLVWVPGDSFMMGSEDGSEDEQPVHQVTLDGFWIGQCEVTNAQYRAFCDTTRRTFPVASLQGDDHPVVSVGWYDAQAYCDYYGYLLPTEAQWEYAAAGPDAHTYPWGDGWDQQLCCNDANRGPGGKTFPVNSFPAGASWCGALDMAGNVDEWCADWYAADYYQVSPTLNPQGPVAATGVRALRGGAWNGDFDDCRTARRNMFGPTFASTLSGFRVVMSSG